MISILAWLPAKGVDAISAHCSRNEPSGGTSRVALKTGRSWRTARVQATTSIVQTCASPMSLMCPDIGKAKPSFDRNQVLF